MAAPSLCSQPPTRCASAIRPAPRSVRVSAVAAGSAAPTRQSFRAEKPAGEASNSSGGVPAAATAGAAAPQRTGTQLLPWFAKPAQAPAAPLSVAQPGPVSKQPILSFAGGGIFFWWELGCLLYLHRHFDLSKVQLVGASAGGLIATLAACGVDEDKAVRVAFRLGEEYGVFDRPGGLAGIWGKIIREWLDELLPEDAAEMCQGRVRLVVTEVPSLRLRYLQDFESKQDLIDANMASVHIPFFLDGAASCPYRGRNYIDGSLWDFILSDNSDLIKCSGEACVVDYFNDDQLKWSRLDFVKLADMEQVQAFVKTGYAYAERTDAGSDCFERALGEVRKGAMRQLLEVPVWGLRRALASVDS